MSMKKNRWCIYFGIGIGQIIRKGSKFVKIDTGNNIIKVSRESNNIEFKSLDFAIKQLITGRRNVCREDILRILKVKFPKEAI